VVRANVRGLRSVLVVIFFKEVALLHCVEQDLGPFNTLGLASRALCVSYDTPAQLPEITELAAAGRRLFVLGGGSNVVLAPRISSVVVRTATKGVQRVCDRGNDVLVQVQAGEGWHDFVAFSLAQGWYGLENLALIPGTVGAAPVQNIGAYGVELDSRVHSVQAWNIPEGRMIEFSAADCGFSYRDSLFKRSPPGHWLIVSVTFCLNKEWRPVISYPDLQRHPGIAGAAGRLTARDVFNSVCAIRQAKLPDPAQLGNVGSFFKNPVVDQAQFVRLKAAWPGIVAYAQPGGMWKLAAGWLIDQAGWKGYRSGPVGVHQRQALVLVNYGGATAHDIIELATEIKADVQNKFGVTLEQEPVTVR
jgi:UDP-N-acetylmuramate dehydrogenase